MDNLTTEQGNRIIAEFMGARKTGTSTLADGGGYAYEYEVRLSDTETFKFWDKPCWTNVRELKYHSSWDWLMPVVEKIESIGYDTRIAFIRERNNGVDSKTHICDIEKSNNSEGIIYHKGNSKLDATYKAVVQFIQWYNTQNSNK